MSFFPRTLFVWVLLFSGFAFAQNALEGTVTNSQQKPLANVQLSVRNKDGGIVTQASTDQNGRFHLPNLQAGDYELTTQVDGYFSARYDFVLRPRQPLSLSIELQPKEDVKTTVEVHSTYQTVDPEKTASSQTFTRQDLDALLSPMVQNTNKLVANLMPGATQSHDNFINVRGNEFSLHEFINGVSFLDNEQPQFSPGVSPAIFETVDLLTGGFTAEYGNRFGGVLDIATRSGRNLNGHGSLNYYGATQDNHDVSIDSGGAAGPIGYYLFGEGFTSGRYLDPPEPVELNDFGNGVRGAAHFDLRGKQDSLRLLLMGGGVNFQQPNIAEDQEAGRDASRRLRTQTAILSWEHVFTPQTSMLTSLYERVTGDHILPTSDPDTPLTIGSRSTLTGGIKSDLTQAWHGHIIKAGIDLARYRELESFFIDGRGDPDVFPIDFRGSVKGGQASMYVEDHFHLLPRLTVDAGVRYDYFDLVDTQAQTSPRLGFAWSVPGTKSVLRGTYTRLMSPPPIEYSLLASFIGNTAPDEGQRVGNVRAYTQNAFEVGWAQELHSRISLELTAWQHTGHNSFENHEISISRLFLPINFHTARAHGLDVVLNVRRLERLGINARVQYTAQRTYFYGPVSGGFAGDEPLEPGERIIPAFDETHTATAYLIYNNRHWRNFWMGTNMRYGSGSKPEKSGVRLPSHFVDDLGSGFTLWNAEPRRLDMEMNVTNVGDNRYQIAKESDEIPIQFAPSRTIGGTLKLRF